MRGPALLPPPGIFFKSHYNLKIIRETDENMVNANKLLSNARLPDLFAEAAVNIEVTENSSPPHCNTL
jgi:hypothetical protein